VEIIIEGNAMDRHLVDAGVLQGSPVLPIFFEIYTSGRIKWVDEYVSDAEGLSYVHNFGWVGNTIDVNHIVTTLERRAPKSIQWASSQRLKCAT
jgi:hypothetical protein